MPRTMRPLSSVILAVLFFLSVPQDTEGVAPYPTLYRGSIQEEKLVFKAHFQPSFLMKSPGDQERIFDEVEERLEGIRTEQKVGLRAVEPKNLPRLVVDKPEQMFYAVSGKKFYQARAIGLHMVKRPGRCGPELFVQMEAEWVEPSPPFEKSDPPAFLQSDANSDGPLILKGRKFDVVMDKVDETKFRQVRFPKDLPKALKPLFEEEITLIKTDKRYTRPLLFAPQTGFSPLEVAVWQIELPDDTALAFFFTVKGKWKEASFFFKRRQTLPHYSRVISRFDLNHNGQDEYLIEVEDERQSRRMIFELDNNTGKASLLTSTEDTVVLWNDALPGCGEMEITKSAPPPTATAIPSLPAVPPPDREGPLSQGPPVDTE